MSDESPRILDNPQIDPVNVTANDVGVGVDNDTPSFSTELTRSVDIAAIIAQRAAYEVALNDAAVASRRAANLGGMSLLLEHHRDRHAKRWPSDECVAEMLTRYEMNAWSTLMSGSGLWTFLDNAARTQWHDKVNKGDLPALTEDNIRATFQHLYNERGDMFERGVENVFRKLSWDYKSNSPCRFGKRIVIMGATSQPYKNERYGHLNHGHFPNTLDDLLRVMLVLDGKPEPDHNGSAYHLLRSQDAKTHLEKRPRESGAGFEMVRVIDEPGLPAWPHRNNVVLHDMVSLRGFKNGNCHLTFLRPDLVEKLNKIIARRFGNVLPPKED